MPDIKRFLRRNKKTCRACLEVFNSRNELFRHLKKYPMHTCEIQNVQYIIKCIYHTDFLTNDNNKVWDHITGYSADMTPIKCYSAHVDQCNIYSDNKLVNSIDSRAAGWEIFI